MIVEDEVIVFVVEPHSVVEVEDFVTVNFAESVAYVHFPVVTVAVSCVVEQLVVIILVVDYVIDFAVAVFYLS